MKLRPLILCCAMLLAPGALAADVVVLKDGRRFENVRATLGVETLRIETIDGRSLEFPVELMRELRYAPIRRRPAQATPATPATPTTPATPATPAAPTPASEVTPETARETPATGVQPAAPAETTDASPASERADEATAPAAIPDSPSATAGASDRDCRSNRPFLEGLIPIWSPHYCAGRFGWGVFFSATESFLLWNLLLWAPRPPALSESGGYLLNGVALATRLEEGGGARLAALLWWQSLGAETYVHPRGSRGTISRSEYTRQRNGFAALLILALLSDGLSSVWMDQPDAGAAGPGAESGSTARHARWTPEIDLSAGEAETALRIGASYRF